MSIDSIYKESINPELAKLGLKKRVSGIFTLDIAPGVLGWLGLNQATDHHATGEFHINPVVGVRHQEIEKIVAECSNKEYHAYKGTTINRPIGYVMPENSYKTWDFTDANAVEAARDMASAIAAHGIPFMRAHQGLPEIYDKMEKRYHAMDEALAMRRPVTLLLMGDPARSLQALEAELAKLGPRTDPAAAYFRSFADAFRKRFPPT